MRILGVNGIATHGERNIDLLLRSLELLGHDVVDIGLKKRFWMSARWGGRKDGKKIAGFANDGDIVVAHSYGALRTWHAHKTVDFAAIICIAPAMAWKAEWRHPQRVHCFHSESDWAVRIGSWLRWHPFGRAGNRGFKQERVTNVNVPCANHGDYFRGVHLKELTDYVDGIARAQ